MTSKTLSKCLLAILFSFVASQSFSQLYEVKIEEKIANSSLIVEGKVVSQHSFWNAAHTMIYTANRVELYKVFKGMAFSSHIEVLTQGGSVANESINATDLLELEKEHIGVFFCYPNSINLRSPLTGNNLYDVYASSQGFFDYDMDNEKASAPFVSYQKISTDLYGELALKIGHGFQNKKPSFDVAKTKQPITSRTMVPAVLSFSPATVNAGALSDPTNNLLTITGTGFGTFTGSAAILFDDANNGTGGTAYTVAASDATLSTLVVSWTDTEIKVRVPARAGTGFFSVRDASGVSSSSINELKIFYAVLNSNFSISGNAYVKQLNLMNDDGAGGYTIMYSSSTAGGGVDITASPAQATFQRALNTWKEIAGFNVTEGGTTGTQVINPSDNINAIMFDNTNTGNSPLAAGVLAVCYSFSTICTDNPAVYGARKPEFDIVIRNNAVSLGGTSFTFGPCPPNASNNSQIDLETVVFHELGHALNLAHINDGTQGSGIGHINPAKLMNYAITNGTKRTSPDNSAKEGALYTCTPHGYSYGTCLTFNNEMTQLPLMIETKDDCPLVFPTVPTARNTAIAFDMVHTSSKTTVDPSYAQVTCDASTVPVTNNAFYPIMTNYSGTLVLSVSNYTTVPAALASCTEVYTNVPVTGFRLSLYQVGSCPAGQSFPAPVACRTFNANGSFVAITGLLANTNYLIFIESIESTKATFTLTLDGTSLPIKLSSFSGNIVGSYNNLDWVSESIININRITVERSANGTSFENIGEITGSAVYNKKGNFKDFKPTIGSNYYRLKIMDNSGSFEYSNTVLLKRSDKFLISINPNPAVGFAEVQVSSDVKGNYILVLHNSVGQKVLEKALNVNSGVTITRLDVSSLHKGIYSVSVFDQAQEKIKTILLSVQ
jgi:hypothetical protein